jgi:hypothetical protein
MQVYQPALPFCGCHFMSRDDLRPVKTAFGFISAVDGVTRVVIYVVPNVTVSTFTLIQHETARSSV